MPGIPRVGILPDKRCRPVSSLQDTHLDAGIVFLFVGDDNGVVWPMRDLAMLFSVHRETEACPIRGAPLEPLLAAPEC